MLPGSAKAKYFKPHVPEGPVGACHCGYGWVIDRTPRGTTVVTHNGSNGVVTADCHRFVDDGLFLFVAGRSAMRASDDLLRIIYLLAGVIAVTAREVAWEGPRPNRVLQRTGVSQPGSG